MGISNIAYMGAKKLQKQDVGFKTVHKQLQETYVNATNYLSMRQKLYTIGFQSEEGNPYGFQKDFNGRKVKLTLLPAITQDRKLLLKNLQSMVEFYNSNEILELIDIQEKNNQNLFLGGYILYSEGQAKESLSKLESLDLKTLKTFENKLYRLINTKNLFSDNLINPATWSLIDGAIVTDAFLQMRDISQNEKENIKDNVKAFFYLIREKISV